MRRPIAAAAVVGAAIGLDRWLRLARPPAPIRTLVVVDAPIDRTWACVASLPDQLRWMHEMKGVRLIDAERFERGVRGVARVRILGITTSDPVTITDFDPPTRFAIRHEGAFTGSGVIELEPGATGTTTIVRWEERLVPPVLPALVAALQAPLLRAVFQADLLRLKRLVETGSPEGPEPLLVRFVTV